MTTVYHDGEGYSAAAARYLTPKSTPRSSFDQKPTSSPESSAILAAPPATLPTQPEQPRTDNPHAQGAQSITTGLHTPKPSVDLESEVATASIQDAITRLTSGNREATFEEISGVKRNVWCNLRFHERCLPGNDCKVEYFADQEIVRVTLASAVHEAFNPLFDPLRKIAHPGSPFQMTTNQSYLTPSLSTFIPDLSFEKRDERNVVTASIFVECAFSQDEENVKHKAQELLKREGTLLVLCLIIQSTTFHTPYRAPGSITAVSRDRVEVGNIFEDNVEIDSRTWAYKVDGLKMLIYDELTPAEPVECDIRVPSDRECVDLKLVDVLADMMDLEENSGFTGLDWVTFDSQLSQRVGDLAYNRYVVWTRDTGVLFKKTSKRKHRSLETIQRLREAAKKQKQV